jgi:cAMP-dependent protein kinase regulator
MEVVVETSRIAAVPALAELPESEVAGLAALMREREVATGTEVVTVGNYGSAVYFIEQGSADVLGDDGEVNNTLGPGDAFGEIGLLLTGERTATVVASTPMRLLSLSGQDFEGIRSRLPETERSLRRLGLERARH